VWRNNKDDTEKRKKKEKSGEWGVEGWWRGERMIAYCILRC
jgi:hypothetical protein